ncbi:MAG: hypothetical protein QOE79_2571 [Sphingomonadales bacterium]|nr:hypothetical protein [Sphingomonadales bacterium]
MPRHSLRGDFGKFAKADPTSNFQPALKAPEAAPAEGKALTRRQKETIFFNELATVCNVSSALRVSGLASDSRSVYERRRTEPDFRRRWDEAVAEGYALLELEMLERARFGSKRPKPETRVEKRLREVPTAVAMQLLRYYHSRVKAAAPAPAAAPRRISRAQAHAFRRDFSALLSEYNRRMAAHG